MFRYLRIQAHIHQDNISQRMLDHGSYTFAPGKFVVAADMPLPCETPVPLLTSSTTTKLTTKPTTISLPISPSYLPVALGLVSVS
jgi:hypothetical protein